MSTLISLSVYATARHRDAIQTDVAVQDSVCHPPQGNSSRDTRQRKVSTMHLMIFRMILKL